MGGEYFFALLIALILWSLIGLMIGSVALTIWKLERIPWPLIFGVIVIGVTFTFFLLGPTAEQVPPERQYRSPEFCLDERRWGDVLAYSREFAAARGLKSGGGTNEYEGAGLSIGVWKGGSLFRDAEIALYVMSNPFDRQKSQFYAITREKLTPADVALAKQFERGLLNFSCS